MNHLTPKSVIVHVVLALLSLFILWFCLGVGLGKWTNPSDLEEVYFQIRFPRVLVAFLVGLALSVSGAALQALFENPLADPSLIGTSGGAALGVVFVISMGLGGVGIPLAAFLGAMAVCVFILFAHGLFGGGKFGLLILGFIVSAFCGAVVGLVLFLSDDAALRSAMNWLNGSLAEAGFVPPWYGALGIVMGLMVLLPMGRTLDALMLGEESARSMGVKLLPARSLVITGSALLTGAAVAMAGVIGFVGMMIPNLVAMTMGGTRLKIMAYSAWIGGLFIPIVDAASRWITYPVDLPVGMVISLLGGPFFLWLFLKGMRGAMD